MLLVLLTHCACIFLKQPCDVYGCTAVLLWARLAAAMNLQSTGLCISKVMLSTAMLLWHSHLEQG